MIQDRLPTSNIWGTRRNPLVRIVHSRSNYLNQWCSCTMQHLVVLFTLVLLPLSVSTSQLTIEHPSSMHNFAPRKTECRSPSVHLIVDLKNAHYILLCMCFENVRILLRKHRRELRYLINWRNGTEKECCFSVPFYLRYRRPNTCGDVL